MQTCSKCRLAACKIAKERLMDMHSPQMKRCHIWGLLQDKRFNSIFYWGLLACSTPTMCFVFQYIFTIKRCYKIVTIYPWHIIMKETNHVLDTTILENISSAYLISLYWYIMKNVCYTTFRHKLFIRSVDYMSTL